MLLIDKNNSNVFQMDLFAYESAGICVDNEKGEVFILITLSTEKKYARWYENSCKLINPFEPSWRH